MNAKHNILLVFSPGWAPVPPIGLPYLKSYLTTQGYEAHILDLNIEFYKEYSSVYTQPNKKKRLLDKCVKRVIKKSLELESNVIAFNILDPTFLNAMYIGEKLKRALPNNTKFVVGGPHLSYIKDEIFDFNFIDCAIYGEGETGFINFLEKPEKYNKLLYSHPVSNLDLLPYPDFSDLDLSLYPLPLLMTAVGRGCTKKCTFCGELGIFGFYRNRSPANIVREIKRNINEYGIQNMVLSHNLINIDPGWLGRLCDLLITERLESYWIAQVHSSISKQLSKKMYDAGCRLVYNCPETGSQRVADLMGKDINVKLAEKSFRNLYNAKINTSAWFIPGFPTETYQDTKKTFKFIKKIEPYTTEILFSPFGLARNTFIYLNPKLFGITKIEDRKYRQYCYYHTEHTELSFINQLKNLYNLWDYYSNDSFPSYGLYKEIRGILEEKIVPTKDQQFLLGGEFDEGVQFPFKLSGQDINEEYNYTKLFKASFKEVDF